MAKTVVGDVFTGVLAVAALAALLAWKRLPEPLVVAAGALAGLAAYPLLQPGWILK